LIRDNFDRRHIVIQKWIKENVIPTKLMLVILLCMVMVGISYVCFGHQLIEAMYYGKAIGFLNTIIKGQSEHPLESYLWKADTILVCVELALAIILFLIVTNKLIKGCPGIYEFLKRQKVWIVIMIIISGVCLRIVWIYWTDTAVYSDAEVYRSLGWKVANGLPCEEGGKFSHYPTGYPFLLSVAYRMGLNKELGARIVDVLVGTGFPVVLGLIVWLLCGWSVGILAMLVFMTCPNNVCLAGVSMTEAPFCLFFYLAILLGLYGRGVKSKIKTSMIYFVCGVVLGYALLVRGTAVLAIPVMFCYFGIKDWKRRKIRFSAILSLFLGIAIVLAPWVIRNWKVHNRFVLLPTEGGEIFYASNVVWDPKKGGCNNEPDFGSLRQLEKNEVLSSRLGYRLGLRHIKENPLIFIKSLPFRYKRFLHVYRESAKRTGFSIQRKEFKYRMVFSALTRLMYWLIPICLIIFCRRLIHSFINYSEIRFFSILYVLYFLAIPSFLAFNRMHFPFMWLIVLILICSIFGIKKERISSFSNEIKS